jgi:hypothetical protein
LVNESPSLQKEAVKREPFKEGKSEKKTFRYPGVDVMVAIFCDFCQFSATKLAVFSKTNVVMNLF